MMATLRVFPFRFMSRMLTLPARSILCVIVLCLASSAVAVYQSHVKCFGTGDCIITTAYQGGGFNDEYHKWEMECSDGEAMIGIYDATHTFLAIAQLWCYFMFPLKPPSKGIYPYYPSCNVRNLTLQEYYCYDKLYPIDTVDTFVTAIYAPSTADPEVPTLMKCCKTPAQYQLDYSRCQWKYTHDKSGEHYDGYWVVKCDTNFIMTGMGEAMNPWDNQLHFVWIQCCPVLTVPQFVEPSRQIYGGGSNTGGSYGGGSLNALFAG